MDANGLGNQILFAVLFIGGGLVGALLWLFPIVGKTGGSAIPGSLKIKKHHYSFEVGDNLLRFGGATVFSGMDIHLPKPLPHIFLDSKANDYVGRSQYIFENDDKVSLEGDFNEFFQVYVPKEHKALALSILTPDVLQTLKTAAFKYDVEIMETHVRIIVPGAHGLSRNEALKNDLGDAAMAIMKEVDHRLKSWQGSK